MLRSFSSNQIKKFGALLLANDARAISTSIVRNDLYDDWKKLAEKQLKGKNPDNLISDTPEVAL